MGGDAASASRERMRCRIQTQQHQEPKAEVEMEGMCRWAKAQLQRPLALGRSRPHRAITCSTQAVLSPGSLPVLLGKLSSAALP